MIPEARLQEIERFDFVPCTELVVEIRRLNAELERIGWHELTAIEAREVARVALTEESEER